jgi:hypothetical protein
MNRVLYHFCVLQCIGEVLKLKHERLIDIFADPESKGCCRQEWKQGNYT